MFDTETLDRILDSSFVIRVTHTGRRTGIPRILESTYYWDGKNRIYLSGYPGRRDWVANMSAQPSVIVHTVQDGPWLEFDAEARVVPDGDERYAHILNYIERWSSLPGREQRFLRLIIRSTRLNRRLRLPWWGPFYLVKRLLDRMPCVELTRTGEPQVRNTPPPPPTVAVPLDPRA